MTHATKRAIWPIVRRIWITAGIVLTILFFGWSVWAYRASPDAHAAMVSSARVTVQDSAGVLRFIPTPRANVSAMSAPRVALVFFPGALVDPIAYAPIARASAEAGHPSYIIRVPRRAAFGGADDHRVMLRVREILDGEDAPDRWVVAGHSKGAVIASDVAASPPDGLAGVVLIGSSHPRDVDLSRSRLAITKIVGTKDGLASREEVEANAHLLPSTTRWVWVEGGNHSQFGWYYFQPGDRFADIDAASQRTLMIDALLRTLTAVGGA